MYYSAIGLLAMMILFIENYDILLKRNTRVMSMTWKVYRGFLFAVMVYYVTDILWGLIEAAKLSTLLFLDTLVYFIAMAVGVLLWTQYTVAYLGERSGFGKFLMYAGRIFCGGVTVLVIVNIFVPVLFTVDDQCVYSARPVRYVALIVQILLLLMTSIHAFTSIYHKKDSSGKRYRTIALFGLITAVFLTVQIWFPYLPLYTIAYFVGTCILHTFVVSDEKEEYKTELEKALDREKIQNEELKSAWLLAYTDALTGAKSKLAYVEAVEQIDAKIIEGRAGEFAIAVFDINCLKDINDKYGHECGDKYLISAFKMICGYFKNSPVFRIGGDEFVALLEKEDYQNREDILKEFQLVTCGKAGVDTVSIAAGIAEYRAGTDSSFNNVFVRADMQMYRRKKEMKVERKSST